jgi:acyl-CoA thioesterase FadM
MEEIVRVLRQTHPDKVTPFMSGTGIGVILSHLNCTYIRPVLYPDSLLTSLKVTLVGKDRLAISHTMYSTAQSAVVAVGAGEFVSYDYAGSSRCPIPDWLLEAMEALEAERGNAPLEKSDDMGDFPSKRARL